MRRAPCVRLSPTGLSAYPVPSHGSNCPLLKRPLDRSPDTDRFRAGVTQRSKSSPSLSLFRPPTLLARRHLPSRLAIFARLWCVTLRRPLRCTRPRPRPWEEDHAAHSGRRLPQNAFAIYLTRSKPDSSWPRGRSIAPEIPEVVTLLPHRRLNRNPGLDRPLQPRRSVQILRTP